MINNISITTGDPYPLGAYVLNDKSVNLAVVLNDNNKGGIILYHKKSLKEEKIYFKESNRIGNIYCVKLDGIDISEYEYNFFDGEEVFCDPYSKHVIGNEKWGKTPVVLRSGFVMEGKHKRKGCPSMREYADSVFYLLHVRGFTKHKSSDVANKGTYSGIIEKLPYLKSLGVTTIELMPSYEFIEFEEVKQPENVSVMEAYEPIEPKLNYWGYKRGYYFSPKASYAGKGVDPVESFHEMVTAIHSAGMEIVMQFYFPDETKPAMIPEILKFWVKEYHIDGFHLMGNNMPMAILGTEPMLANTKLIYYGFQTYDIYHNNKPKYKNLAQSNDNHMYTMRRFLKSDEGQIDNVINCIKNIDDRIANVHYITNSNGFTLMDLVSFDRKHNEANGENNRDGNPYNASWNCGFEGHTSKKSIVKLRHRQIKNAILLNIIAEGAPLVLSGDEFGNSQKGNNNPYCLDNQITWLNWNDVEKNRDIFDFYKKAINFRNSNPVLRKNTPYKMSDYNSVGLPDISFHGEEAWKLETDVLSRHFAYMLSDAYADGNSPESDCNNNGALFIAVNMHWSAHSFAIPNAKGITKWVKVFDTAVDSDEQVVFKDCDKELVVKERSIVILKSGQ